MNFQDKIQSMKASEIIRAMISGLRKEHVKIDMTTFGAARNGTCFGCAATNAVCEISNEVFTAKTIKSSTKRTGRERPPALGQCSM